MENSVDHPLGMADLAELSNVVIKEMDRAALLKTLKACYAIFPRMPVTLAELERVDSSHLRTLVFRARRAAQTSY